MHPSSKLVIDIATSIQGYDAQILLNDLLTNQRQLIPVSKAAEEFCVNRGTVYNWIKEGKIKIYHCGKTARVNRCEIINSFKPGELAEEDKE